MTAPDRPIRSSGPPPRAALLLMALLGAAVAAAAVIAVTVARAGAADSRRSAVDSYTSAINPIAADTGQEVVQSIRPALGDYTAGRLGPEQLAAAGTSWSTYFSNARRRLDAVPPPPELRLAALTFDAALDLYRDAMASFARAGLDAAPDREAGLQPGILQATAADRTWDRAAARLESARHAVGLGEAPRFHSRPVPSPPL